MLSIRLNELTASDIVRAVRRGDVTCESIVRACLERIDEREDAVQAWEYIDRDAVLRTARSLDVRGARGILAGVPFGVKDIIDTADIPSQYGSPIYAGHQPKTDAACVALSRKADAVLLGKTVTTEFANRHPARTRHPLDPARTSGGSSSGSAAAVADSMVPVALGTQTTGSTIKPGSFCGVFAYRPTFGELSCGGVKQSAWSLDTLGIYARSVEDISRYRDALLGRERESILHEVAKPRVAFCRTHKWDEIEPATRALFEDAARRLRQTGVDVRDVTLPTEFDEMEEAHKWISSYEFSRNYTWEIENHWEQISETLRKGRLKNGLSCTFERYSQAKLHVEQTSGMLDGIFDDYDVLLTSPVVGEAPVGFGDTGNSSLCGMWTALHVPVVTIPVFRGPNNLPIGAQLIARRGSDEALFGIADSIYKILT